VEFGGLGELAAKEVDEAAGARAAVGAQQTHTVEKNQEIETSESLRPTETGAFGLLLFDLGNESD